jgi:hypothetical protein
MDFRSLFIYVLYFCALFAYKCTKWTHNEEVMFLCLSLHPLSLVPHLNIPNLFWRNFMLGGSTINVVRQHLILICVSPIQSLLYMKLKSNFYCFSQEMAYCIMYLYMIKTIAFTMIYDIYMKQFLIQCIFNIKHFLHDKGKGKIVSVLN